MLAPAITALCAGFARVFWGFMVVAEPPLGLRKGHHGNRVMASQTHFQSKRISTYRAASGTQRGPKGTVLGRKSARFATCTPASKSIVLPMVIIMVMTNQACN